MPAFSVTVPVVSLVLVPRVPSVGTPRVVALSASAPGLHAGDYGVVLQVSTGLDMDETAALEVTLKRPDRTRLTYSFGPDVIVDAPRGVIAFVLGSGDLTRGGNYQIQVVDVTPGRALASAVVTFYVAPNI